MSIQKAIFLARYGDQQHISDALEPTSDTNRVAEAAARNKNISSENLSKALKHPDPHIRYYAIHNPRATREHALQAINDPDQDVGIMAKIIYHR